MKLSIIVPVYKVEQYFPRCVESILAQTFTDFELILVDDGSPDGCPAICDEYAQRDGRIKVIHKENGGLSDARNAGLDIAQGKYIGFVDSDDLITPQMYEKLVRLADLHNADIAVCGIQIIDEKMNYGGKLPEKIQVAVYGHDEIIKNFSYISSQIMPSVANKVFRRELFGHLRFPKGKIYEDGFIQLELLDMCNTVVVTDYYGYCYQEIREGSITNTSFTARNFDLIELNYRNMSFFRQKRIESQFSVLMEEYVDTYLRQSFMVYSRNTELRHVFKKYYRQYLRSVPMLIAQGKMCRLKKLVILLACINWKLSYRICEKYFPECIDSIMRQKR